MQSNVQYYYYYTVYYFTYGIPEGTSFWYCLYAAPKWLVNVCSSYKMRVLKNVHETYAYAKIQTGLNSIIWVAMLHTNHPVYEGWRTTLYTPYVTNVCSGFFSYAIWWLKFCPAVDIAIVRSNCPPTTRIKPMLYIGQLLFMLGKKHHSTEYSTQQATCAIRAALLWFTMNESVEISEGWYMHTYRYSHKWNTETAIK